MKTQQDVVGILAVWTGNDGHFLPSTREVRPGEFPFSR